MKSQRFYKSTFNLIDVPKEYIFAWGDRAFICESKKRTLSMLDAMKLLNIGYKQLSGSFTYIGKR